MFRQSLVLVAAVLSIAVLPAAAPANTVPNWFWHWASWSMHGKHGQPPADRPARIPGWAWKLLRLHEQHAKAAAAVRGRGSGKQNPPAPTPPTPTPPAPTPPAPRPAPTPTPPPPSDGLNASEQALLAAVNATRAQNGLGALLIDAHLEQAARAHTDDLLANNAFTHDFIKNGTAYPFATWIGWYYTGTCAGENLALGQGGLSAATAVQLWLGSPGHRANLLSPAYHTVGVALAGANGAAIAATDFGGC